MNIIVVSEIILNLNAKISEEIEQKVNENDEYYDDSCDMLTQIESLSVYETDKGARFKIFFTCIGSKDFASFIDADYEFKKDEDFEGFKKFANQIAKGIFNQGTELINLITEHHSKNIHIISADSEAKLYLEKGDYISTFKMVADFAEIGDQELLSIEFVSDDKIFEEIEEKCSQFSLFEAVSKNKFAI